MKNSLYGGHDGRSVIIAKSYPTVKAMTEDFKTGGGCVDVAYGDYVIIDCENHNNPEHGRMYKRGLNYQSTNSIDAWEFDNNATTVAGAFTKKSIPCYGAIYYGSLVGPMGNAPRFILGNYNYITNDAETTIQNFDDNNLIGDNTIDASDFPIFDQYVHEGSFTADGDSIVPGNTKINGDYIDSIQYKCMAMRNSTGELSYAFVGFKIPYYVADFEAESVSPYHNRNSETAIFKNNNLATPSKEGAFYNKYKISVPRGIHGRSIENIRIGTYQELLAEVANANNKYKIQNGIVSNFAIDINHELKYTTGNQTLQVTLLTAPNANTTLGNTAKIIVCDLVDYNVKPEGDRYMFYIGPYNIISNVSMSDEGKITVEYSYDSKKVLNNSNPITWVENVSLGADGKFVMGFNNNTIGNNEKYETTLVWPATVKLNNNGLFTSISNTGVTTNLNTINWINDIDLTQDGKFTVTGNNNTLNVEKTLKWIDNIQFDNDSGLVKWYYNNNHTTPAGTHQMDWITNAEMVTDTDNDGTKHYYLSLETAQKGSLFPEFKENQIDLRTVTKIYSNPNETAILAAYNDGTIDTVISDITNLTSSMDVTSTTIKPDGTIGEIDTRLSLGGICYVIGEDANG